MSNHKWSKKKILTRCECCGKIAREKIQDGRWHKRVYKVFSACTGCAQKNSQSFFKTMEGRK